MEPEILPLQIAAGIILAATVLLMGRIAIRFWQDDKIVGALSLGAVSAIFWIALLSAGLGIAGW